jgi:hypothetical protein
LISYRILSLSLSNAVEAFMAVIFWVFHSDAKSLNNLQGLSFHCATVIHRQSGIAMRIQGIEAV